MGRGRIFVAASLAVLWLVACAGLIGLEEPVAEKVDASGGDTAETGTNADVGLPSPSIEAGPAPVFDPAFNDGGPLLLAIPTVALARYGNDGGIAYLVDASANVVDSSGREIDAGFAPIVPGSVKDVPFAVLRPSSLAWIASPADSAYLALAGIGTTADADADHYGVWVAPLNPTDAPLGWSKLGLDSKVVTSAVVAHPDGPSLFWWDPISPTGFVGDGTFTHAVTIGATSVLSASSLAVTSTTGVYGALVGAMNSGVLGLQLVNPASDGGFANSGYMNDLFAADAGVAVDSFAVAALPSGDTFVIVASAGGSLEEVLVPAVRTDMVPLPIFHPLAMAAGLHITSIAVSPSGATFYVAGCLVDSFKVSTPWIARVSVASSSLDYTFGEGGIMMPAPTGACVQSFIFDGAGHPNALVNTIGNGTSGPLASYVYRFNFAP